MNGNKGSIGFRRSIVDINPGIIQTLEAGGFIPVIAPVGVGGSGETYNINADWVASNMQIYCLRFIAICLDSQ